MPQLGVAIVVVVFVNGAFSFVQEDRAERATAALRDLLPVESTVLRDGRRATVARDASSSLATLLSCVRATGSRPMPG